MVELYQVVRFGFARAATLRHARERFSSHIGAITQGFFSKLSLDSGREV